MKATLTVVFDRKREWLLIYIDDRLIQTFSCEKEKEMSYWIVCYASNSNMMIDFKERQDD